MVMIIESMSGLPVTRSLVSLSRGTRLVSRKYSRRSECLPSPSRLVITSSCCASDSGSNFTCQKCSLNRFSTKPAGRDVTSMTWPCGARTSVTCRSISSRALPPSSMPSSSTSARRAISACRSMQYRSEPAPCTHCRKASTQFQLRSKMGPFASVSRWRCSSCTLMRMGTMSHSSDCRTCMTSCDIKHVFPAAGGAVRSRQAAGPASAASRRATYDASSHDARPSTSFTFARLDEACSIVVTMAAVTSATASISVDASICARSKVTASTAASILSSIRRATGSFLPQQGSLIFLCICLSLASLSRRAMSSGSSSSLSSSSLASVIFLRLDTVCFVVVTTLIGTH
eukprot:scaffold22842_cov65-Phaeocystis_antarctica.AAC.4